MSIYRCMEKEDVVSINTPIYLFIYNKILHRLRKKDILLSATARMNLEDIVLEISQIEKDRYCMLSLIYGPLKKLS